MVRKWEWVEKLTEEQLLELERNLPEYVYRPDKKSKANNEEGRDRELGSIPGPSKKRKRGKSRERDYTMGTTVVRQRRADTTD